MILNTHGGQKALVDLVAMRLRAELKMLVAIYEEKLPSGKVV